jgi:hypothetical protein
MTKNKMVENVCAKIYEKYKEFSGVKPSVTSQTPEKYLLLFKINKELPNGKELKQILRVVSDMNGEIQKISSSRG